MNIIILSDDGDFRVQVYNVDEKYIRYDESIYIKNKKGVKLEPSCGLLINKKDILKMADMIRFEIND